MNNHQIAVNIKCLLALLILFVIDIGPIPVTAAIGLFVVIFKPRWFLNLVTALYGR
jgi:hypothetical protein